MSNAAFHEARALIAELSQNVTPEVSKKFDRIEELMAAYMESHTPPVFEGLGLTPNESRMLELLARRRGMPITRDQLMAVCVEVHGKERDLKLVDVNLSRIRKKSKGTPYEGVIKTVHGIGWTIGSDVVLPGQLPQ